MSNGQEMIAVAVNSNDEDLPPSVADEGVEKVLPYHSVRKYLLEISSRKLLTAREEADLSHRIHQNGDRDAREKLITHNLLLVPWVAKRFLWSKLPFEDLVQEGNIGLMISVEKFNPSLGRFSNYAKWWIEQSIRRGIMNQSDTLRLPVHVLDLQRKIEKTRRALVNDGILKPSTCLLAKYTGESEERIKNALRARLQYCSIEESFDDDQAKEMKLQIRDTETIIPETFVDAYQQLMIACDSLQTICDRIANLPKVSERDISMFRCYYGLNESAEPMTLDETGKLFGGLTRERVRQIVNAIWTKVKQSSLGVKDDDIKKLLWQISELEGITGTLVKFKL